MEGALRPGDPAALCSSCLGLVTVSKVLQLQGHLVGKMGGPEELKAGPPKDPRTLRLSFPIWTAEGCACPLLISLWNPRWGPLFGDDPSPKPSSCSPSHTLLPAPQPLTLAPPPLPPQATRWVPTASSVFVLLGLLWGKEPNLGLAGRGLAQGSVSLNRFLCNNQVFIVSETWRDA